MASSVLSIAPSRSLIKSHCVLLCKAPSTGLLVQGLRTAAASQCFSLAETVGVSPRSHCLLRSCLLRHSSQTCLYSYPGAQELLGSLRKQSSLSHSSLLASTSTRLTHTQLGSPSSSRVEDTLNTSRYPEPTLSVTTIGRSGTGGRQSTRRVHVALSVDEEVEEDAEEAVASALAKDGPDQILPATSHKVHRVRDAVKLHMEESGPASEAPVSLHSLLQDAALKHPKHKALQIRRDGKLLSWTYEEYFTLSRTVAKAYIALGLEPFHGVCIMGCNSPEWFIANCGSIFAGGVAVGVYPNNTGEASVHIASDSLAQIIVVDNEETAARLLAVRHKMKHVKAIVQWLGEPKHHDVISWQQLIELGQQQNDDALLERLRMQAVNRCAALIYTSGTTGLPKGVMCSQDSLTWCGKQISRYFDLKLCNEVVVSYLPLSHIAGQMADLYCAIPHLMTVHFARPDALRGSLVGTLKEVQPTAFLTVPRLLEKMKEELTRAFSKANPVQFALIQWARNATKQYHAAQQQGRTITLLDNLNYKLAKMIVIKKIKKAIGLSAARHCVTGSAPISDEVLDFFLSLDLIVLNGYGLSETGSVGTVSTDDKGYHRPGSVGKPVPFTKVGIMKTDRTSNADSGEGEIAFKGRFVFMGYLNSQEKTDETIRDDGWMLSGDLGWFDDDGHLYITGRSKELIVTAGGENIAPLPIEDFIKKQLSELVANVMVVGDRRRFLSVLLTIRCEVDVETMAPRDALPLRTVEWLENKGVHAHTVTEVRQNLEDHHNGAIYEMVQQAIDRYNSENAASNIHKIRRWTVLPHDFSLATGELNNTLKLKRKFVLDKYSHVIDRLYDQ